MSFTTTAGKVYPRALLQKQIDVWRAQGLSVVMTNGCYDLLHAGHIHTLETARTYGNVLIVGINSDASVKRLKGPERPLNNEDDRARVIAALACIDAVTIFDEDTAIALLECLRPDIYVKGGDYSQDTLPERGIVERHGGRVVFCPLLPGRSTTQLIASCRG
jgi:rfaE bifunctional protein nucleotidyltransferase chain/domain